LTTLINIYDRIQDYYDQAKLVYIAHIGSSMADKIADEKLDNAVNELKREIRFNIILGHLKRATNAFKQWVFPFANVEFHSEKISTEPFFVWENDKYSHEISKLLIGEEITIKADITKIDSNKSAVKFNEI
ncbi:9115_t:CDS:2, partial [Scutellospora calospora]